MMDKASVDFSVAVACHSGLLWGAPKIKANISPCLQMCRVLKKVTWYIRSADGERGTVPEKSPMIYFFFFLFFPSKTDAFQQKFKIKSKVFPLLTYVFYLFVGWVCFGFPYTLTGRKQNQKETFPFIISWFLALRKKISNACTWAHTQTLTNAYVQNQYISGGLFFLIFSFFVNQFLKIILILSSK